jgi:hypothetical protein
MVSWQSLARGSRRASVIVVLALALLVASAVHYLGFLLPFPFAAAEGFRVIQKRRVDWRVAAAIGSPAGILAIYTPLMLQAGSHMGIHWGKPHLFSAASDVLETFVLPAMPVLAVLLVAGFLFTQLTSKPVKLHAVYRLPRDEFVLVVAVLSLPLITMLLGRFATHAFVARYSIAAMAGLAIVLTYSIGTLFLDRREPAIGGLSHAGGGRLEPGTPLRSWRFHRPQHSPAGAGLQSSYSGIASIHLYEDALLRKPTALEAALLCSQLRPHCGSSDPIRMSIS